MKFLKKLTIHLPWVIVAICMLQIVLCIMLQHTNEAFAWIIAAIGWLSYKMET